MVKPFELAQVSLYTYKVAYNHHFVGEICKSDFSNSWFFYPKYPELSERLLWHVVKALTKLNKGKIL